MFCSQFAYLKIEIDPKPKFLEPIKNLRCFRKSDHDPQVFCSKLSKLAIHLAWQSSSSLPVAMMSVYNLEFIIYCTYIS